ncbi:aldehyde dehydrogenase family protein [Kineobactrum salinum]|uniref:Aldehyde dehydrogenase family protein n=1 Tax=Kineobactrum salinum TaxID=2708301 RepID=A0A6C0U4J0_9GAMM|nr:aldehyde dehydrogenase family protein [Kineobactrum salinum]QIB66339.1 aldehyde dehydrogenase family protein [Kineobactrum salinum]
MSDFKIVSPVDGSVYATCHYADPARIRAAAETGRKAFAQWRQVPFAERARMVRSFLSVLDKHRERLAELVTWQMGRPSWQADEMDRMLQSADVLIGDAAGILQPPQEKPDDNITRSVQRIPMGLCLSICAWNYPVAMSASLILAPLLMGNVVLFKHAPQTALIAEVFGIAAAESDLPDGVLQTLHMTHPDTEALIGSGLVDLVEFIGSTRAGMRYTMRAGAPSPATAWNWAARIPSISGRTSSLTQSSRTCWKAATAMPASPAVR